LYTRASLGVIFAITVFFANRIWDRKRRAARRIAQSELDGFWGAIHVASLPFTKILIHAGRPERAFRFGLGLRFEPSQAPGNCDNDEFDALAPDDFNRMGETETVAAQLGTAFTEKRDQTREGNGVHWVGGHPSFVQNDVRGDPENRALDRVLLHLGVDDDVCIGDSGELNLLISKEDLADLAFERSV